MKHPKHPKHQPYILSFNSFSGRNHCSYVRLRLDRIFGIFRSRDDGNIPSGTTSGRISLNPLPVRCLITAKPPFAHHPVLEFNSSHRNGTLLRPSFIPHQSRWQCNDESRFDRESREWPTLHYDNSKWVIFNKVNWPHFKQCQWINLNIRKGQQNGALTWVVDSFFSSSSSEITSRREQILAVFF